MESFEEIKLDGEQHLLGYTLCDCSVWPVIIGMPINKCGHCGGSAHGIYVTKGCCEIVRYRSISAQNLRQEPR